MKYLNGMNSCQRRQSSFSSLSFQGQCVLSYFLYKPKVPFTIYFQQYFPSTSESLSRSKMIAKIFWLLFVLSIYLEEGQSYQTRNCKTELGRTCTEPFKYRGKQYASCTEHGEKKTKYWCYTGTHGVHWDYCTANDDCSKSISKKSFLNPHLQNLQFRSQFQRQMATLGIATFSLIGQIIG